MVERRPAGLRRLRKIMPVPAHGSAPEVELDPKATTARPTAEESLIDAAVYRRGRRVASPATVADTHRQLTEHEGAMAWIGLYRPTDAQVWAAAEAFGLHELAVEDAIVAHQRPKLERYDNTLFVVLRAARYLDHVEEVEFGEIHLFVGSNFVITVRHGQAPDLAAVRRRAEDHPELLARGPQAVLYAIMDSVVDGYAPVVAGLQNDIDEIETEVFGGDPNVSRRIYELSREVIEFQRSTRPLGGMLDNLDRGSGKYGVDEELRQYVRDVADHATAVAERVDGFRQMLSDILTVNSTLVAQAQNAELARMADVSNSQNEQVKRISAWAAILFAPTLIGTVYGMNFHHMPELRWPLGYPFALVLMAAVCAGLWVIFRRRDWL
ncbi:MAG TPA: magnesium and cobalt transport protein CorA [Micromonosporaceae bacterium]